MSFDITIKPHAPAYSLILAATTAISHHDAAVQDDSNRNLFNRQKQIVSGDVATALPDQALIDALAKSNPVPEPLAPSFSILNFPEFVAVAIIRQFLDIYNTADGEGIFTGYERHRRLEARARQCAIGAATLREWWERLRRALNVNVPPSKHLAALRALLLVPGGLQQLVLRELTEASGTIVMLAQEWHDVAKRQDPTYAERAGQSSLFPVSPERSVLRFSAEDLVPGQSAGAMVMEVPAITSNSIRHQLVRAPGWLHLRTALEIADGALAPGQEAIFLNGGNIRAGAKQSGDIWTQRRDIRTRFPFLDLVGGVTNTFDLGESRLKVKAHLVCRENATALADTIAAGRSTAALSVFDMLDDVTLTRQGEDKDSGQMIFSFETLCAGAEVLVQLSLDPGTRPLAHGALLAALATYLNDPAASTGGGGARGYGFMRCVDSAGLVESPQLGEYETYLHEHADALRQEILSGRLGTAVVQVS